MAREASTTANTRSTAEADAVGSAVRDAEAGSVASITGRVVAGGAGAEQLTSANTARPTVAK
jgi:hypothetical protein